MSEAVTPAYRTDERILRVRGVDLCVDTAGDPADPAVLLVSGAASSMDWWEDAFCERLSDAHRHVIRYDHRDTGRSVSSEPGRPAYAGRDLVEDVTGVLDTLGVASAHVVGISMGGGIAQEVAVTHPDRLRTLTLMATSPAMDAGAAGVGLPPPAERITRSFTEPDPDPDWSDRDAVIAYYLDAERLFAGSIPVDEARIRRLAGQAFDRTTSMAASQNHWSLGDEPEPAGAAARSLAEIGVPTLVLHGTEDPLFPIQHGEALARAIPDARPVPLEGMGHQLPPPQLWDRVVAAILEHTAPPA